MVDGRAAVVVHLLPLGSPVGRAPLGRPMTRPARPCERRLQYDALHRPWQSR